MRYHRVNPQKLTFREYWRSKKSWKEAWAVPIAWLFPSLQPTQVFRHFESIKELEIEEAAFPAVARAKLQTALETAHQLGFHSPRYYRFSSTRGETSTSFIVLLHPSGRFMLRLFHVLSTVTVPPTENRVITIASLFSDGTELHTGDQTPRLQPRPETINNPQPGQPLEALVAAHERLLEKLSASKRPEPIDSIEAMELACNRIEQGGIQFGLKRGLTVWLTPEEVQAEQRTAGGLSAMKEEGLPHTEVLAALEPLQRAKPSSSSMLILMASLMFFIAVGVQGSGWSYLLILVPVLLFHELGHYIAMRAFNYSNVRMFFIPFVGAAVSGKHYNVAAWKKVVVSLMGPLPGLLLGAAIGGVGLVLHNPLLTKIGLVAVTINGFNLIPILPLDGGWIIHALLLSRHPLLDVGFQVVACAALVAFGVFSQAKIFVFLAVIMAVAIPVSFRLARVAAKLRKYDLKEVSDDDQTIPRDTAQAIIGEIKTAFPTGQTTKSLAEKTLLVFAKLNARPSGVLASVALLLVQLVGLVVAVAFTVVLAFGSKSPGFAAGLPDGGNGLQFEHRLECGPTRVWAGAHAEPRIDAPQLIATFKEQSLAEHAFGSWSSRLPQTSKLALFGDTLLVALPAGQDALRDDVLGQLSAQAQDAFWDTDDFKGHLSMLCVARTERDAEEIAQELGGYLNFLKGSYLVPPWLPEGLGVSPPPEHTLARKTFAKLRASRWADIPMQSAERDAIYEQLTKARKRGDNEGIKGLSKQLEMLRVEDRSKAIQSIRRGDKGPVDRDAIDLYVALFERGNPSPTIETEGATDLALRLGQMPLENGSPSADLHRYSAIGGFVHNEGKRVSVLGPGFTRVADGAPALAEWLCNRGCTDLQYQFRGSPTGEGVEEDVDDE